MSIMAVSKRMLVSVCILFVIINMHEIVTSSRFSDYGDQITDVSSYCHLTQQACKRSRATNRFKSIARIGEVSTMNSLDNTVRMTDTKNDIDDLS